MRNLSGSEMEKILHKKIVREYYSKRARDYNVQKTITWKSRQGFDAQMLDEVTDLSADLEKKPLLEVGFGSGRIGLPLLRKIKPWLVGLDLSKEMLQLAKDKTSPHKENLDLILGDAEHLPFTDMVFHAIICIGTMHYLMNPEVSLEEFSRTLKEKGFLVYGDVTLHELDNQSFIDKLEKTISKAHSRYYKPSQAKKMLENHSFHVSKINTIRYRKSYVSLMEDKAKYFHVEIKAFNKQIQEASANERELYAVNSNGLTLFYTLVKAQKWTLTT